jgi:putative nucleotidyltransferase with HDIG domain
LPSGIVEIMRLANDEDASATAVASAIEYEPALSANVLRLANSSLFGGRGTVRSVREAVVRLGMRRLLELLTAEAVAPNMRRPVNGYALEGDDMWKHAVVTALAVNRLAQLQTRRPPEYAFTAGIVHDIGKLALSQFVEVDVKAIEDLALHSGTSFEEAEREVIGIDHAEAGAVLLESWGLPQELVDIVRMHHRPDEAPNPTDLLYLVHVGDLLALCIGSGDGLDGLAYRAAPSSLQRVGITERRTLERLIADITDSFDEVREIYSMQL